MKGLHLNRHSSCSALRRIRTASETSHKVSVSVREPGCRDSRPALYPAKKKWSLKEQYDGTDYLTPVDDAEIICGAAGTFRSRWPVCAEQQTTSHESQIERFQGGVAAKSEIEENPKVRRESARAL